MSATLFRGKLAQGALSRSQIEAHSARLAKIREIAERHHGRQGGEADLGRIALWIMHNWPEQELWYLADHLR